MNPIPRVVLHARRLDRSRHPLALVLAVAIIAPAVALAQQHRATRLGNPATRFAKKPPRTPDDVRLLLRSEKTRADVAAILSETGWRGDIEDFDRAVAEAEITEIEIAPGTRLPFMASREKARGHRPHALMDVLWAGRTPIKAFAFDMVSKCTKYRVVTPLACGNFWFDELGKDDTGACAPPPPPPVVNVSSTGEACVTQPVEITVNVQNPPADGAITIALNGKALTTGTLTAGAYRAVFPGAPQPGAYEVRATSGGVSSTTEFEVKPCPPTCSLDIRLADKGHNLVIDASRAQTAPGVSGRIRSVNVEVLSGGAVLARQTLTPPNLVARLPVTWRGFYSVRALVVDELGQASVNACSISADPDAGLTACPSASADLNLGDMRQFPRKLPMPTFHQVVPHGLLVHSDGDTLRQVFNRITDALNAAGFGGAWRVYAVGTCGFAVAARQERILADGRPDAPRWGPRPPNGFLETLKRMLKARPGHYRIIVLVLSVDRIEFETVGSEQAQQFIDSLPREGGLQMTMGYGEQAVPSRREVETLVYEFIRPAPDDPVRLLTEQSNPLSWSSHVVSAGLWRKEQLP